MVQPTASGAGKVGIIQDSAAGPAARHGLRKLAEALRAKSLSVAAGAALAGAEGDALIVAGTAGGGGEAARLLKELSLPAPQGAEALRIHRFSRQGTPAVLCCGADDRGAMYALLDVAQRIGWATAADPLRDVANADEKPSIPQRALSKYTMHRGVFEAIFHDPNYWAAYFDMLAEDRFNSFVLIFGYENGGYFAPPYPYFFDVPGFDGIRVVGITADQQRRNLASLNRIIDMAHERGLDFTVGIWDHIYRGGVQGPTEHARQPTPGLVWGLTPANLNDYTKAAFRQFLQAVPRFDAVQFRMHNESGLTNQEMLAFWPEVYAIVKQERPGLRFDARAKEYPDSLIDKALEAGLNFRITTKYWAEQLGLPFHPTHINRQNQFDRRHQYADLLRYPQRYPMHWRLWTGGTTRILLWGDPQFVRRFAESTHLYDGQGFEVNEMLATKMQDHPHAEKPFELLSPKYRYYDWEFQRYWHFYQVFGRVGYNPAAPADIWEREFARRLGPTAGPLVQKALHRASWILPRITACVFPYGSFPTTRGWAEKQRRGDLPQYAKAEVSDTEQFLTMAEAAAILLAGGESAKVWPQQTAGWFAAAGGEVLALAAEAEKAAAGSATRELQVSLVDLRILANLALFHARRMPAGVWWCLFESTGDVRALEEAIRGEEQAVTAWEALVAAAGDVYADDLKFGRASAGLSGHWRDELEALRRGLAALRQRREQSAPRAGKKAPASIDRTPAGGDSQPPTVSHEPIASAPAGKAMTVEASVQDPSGVKWVRLRYRGVNQHFDYRTLEMLPAGDGGLYRAEVPVEHVEPQWDFMYFIEAMDKAGNGCIFPDLEKQTPYVVVRLKR